MDFTFMESSGKVAFYRSDAEQAEWCQDERTITATFPYLSDKVIKRGMMLLIQNPANNRWQVFIVRTASSYAYDGYQQILAEDLAIAELLYCHLDEDIEITDKTAKYAINKVLPHTGWNAGTSYVDNESSCNIGRGSVWQAISTIQSNWNVYIEPRYTVYSDGRITRFLDIRNTEGEWNGVRLAVNKNVTDPSVTYDDSELYTALYGYGGTYTEGEGDDAVTKETVFDNVVWSATSDHPAKPAGQRYIVDPDATEIYGREGYPRFGYFQNMDILDPEILLEKTWQSLRQCNHPKINIQGTVSDLKRMGYADQPLQLHDLVIVELEPLGLQFYKQVIKCTINLLDPTANTVEIGDYIPNIIYINRDIENDATGGAKGRGGGTKNKQKDNEFQTEILQDQRNISINAKHIDNHGNILQQAGMYIDPITGVLIYAEDNERNVGSKFKVQSDMIKAEVRDRSNADKELKGEIKVTSDKIKLEVSERKAQGDKLYAKIEVTAGQIRSEVSDVQSGLESSITQQADRISLVVEGTGANAKIKPAAIVAAINDGSSSIKISADHIVLDGDAVADSLDSQSISVSGLDCSSGTISVFECDNNFEFSGSTFKFGEHNASWKSQSVITGVGSSSYTRKWAYYDGDGNLQSDNRAMVFDVSKTSTTIYYLGR